MAHLFNRVRSSSSSIFPFTITFLVLFTGNSLAGELRPSDHGLQYQFSSPPTESHSPPGKMKSFFGDSHSSPPPSHSQLLRLDLVENHDSDSKIAIPTQNRALPQRFQSSLFQNRASLAIPSASGRFRFRFRFRSGNQSLAGDSVQRRSDQALIIEIKLIKTKHTENYSKNLLFLSLFIVVVFAVSSLSLCYFFSFIFLMNPHKTEEGLFHHHDLDPTADILVQSQPSILHHHHDHNSEVDPAFSLPEFVLFRSSPSGDSPGHSSDEHDDSLTGNPQIDASSNSRVSSAGRDGLFISPDPHISSQFYTFNAASHSLMIRCLREVRLATPAEIRIATPRSVLKSWRAVWKDRNEETAYLTAWKRIQDKLTSRLDPATGNEFLCFKNNSQQFVSHINQWQDIVMGFHGDGDLKHLGPKETIERIKQVWTVGAKLYGIPESFIRVCVAACPVCNADSGSGSRNKRRRFEYTESFDVPAKEVPDRLQQLAAKHKVVLCIRQKYIRYKPFMAEVKDYACHRAGEPVSIKKSRILKREPYQSKRCGCGFRIRAIVPIANYSEKTKTFVYQEEGTAVFKLYAVHSGHEPGAMDGNARIMHRVVGHKGFLMDQETVYGVQEDLETEGMGLTGKDDGAEMQFAVLHQVQELRSELGTLEGKIGNFSQEMLGSVSTELFEMLNKIRNIGVESVKDTTGLVSEKSHSDEILVGDNDLTHWSDHHHEHLYGDGKDAELIEDDEDSFERSLDDVVPWEQIRPPSDCRSQKDLLAETCKPDKWLKCNDFDDENSILNSEDSKLTKPMNHDGGSIVTDVGLAGIQVDDSFYQENSKWYDSPCGLDSNTDGEDNGFRHGEIL